MMRWGIKCSTIIAIHSIACLTIHREVLNDHMRTLRKVHGFGSTLKNNGITMDTSNHDWSIRSACNILNEKSTLIHTRMNEHRITWLCIQACQTRIGIGFADSDIESTSIDNNAKSQHYVDTQVFHLLFQILLYIYNHLHNHIF